MSFPINVKLIASIGYDQTPTDTLTATVASKTVFGTANVNVDSAYNTSTGDYTCPYDGLYQCEVTISIGGVAVTPNNVGASVTLKKNGTSVGGSAAPTFSTGIGYVTSFSIVVSCVAGDVLTFWSRSDLTTPTYATFIDNSSFSIVRIGEI